MLLNLIKSQLRTQIKLIIVINNFFLKIGLLRAGTQVCDVAPSRPFTRSLLPSRSLKAFSKQTLGVALYFEYNNIEGRSTFNEQVLNNRYKWRTKRVFCLRRGLFRWTQIQSR